MSTADRAENEKAKHHRIEFQFPLVLVKTRSFMTLYERLGAWKTSRLFSWAALISMPIVAGFGFYLISNTILAFLTIPEAREAGRKLGPQAYILLPGINPYLPILYGWIGIIIAIVVHEGAHGVIARSLGFTVRSSGLLFFLAIPVGAFVDVDEEQLESAEAKDSVRVLAAGPGANVAVALVSLVTILIITSGLSPLVDGLYVARVVEGMPAEDAGLLVGDVIVMIDDEPITTVDDFTAALEGKSPGDLVLVTVARGERWRDRISMPVKLTEYEGRPVIGVIMGEMLVEQRLRTYQKLATETILIHFQPPTLAQVPFSETLHAFYTHPLGEHWYLLANLFFWVWFVNVNVAIFNTLPIHPLDGGQTFKHLLRYSVGRKAGETVISRLTNAVTGVVISAIVMMIVLPYIM
ncbi:MAG: site-2 protease family protein [Candidatus Bathyarchaeia archaeon]